MDCCIDTGVGFDDVRVPLVPSVNFGATGCEIEGACCASGSMPVVDGRLRIGEGHYLKDLTFVGPAEQARAVIQIRRSNVSAR